MSDKETKEKGEEAAKGPKCSPEMCRDMMSGGMPDCCAPQMRDMMSRFCAPPRKAEGKVAEEA
jgi:hypothetical protein